MTESSQKQILNNYPLDGALDDCKHDYHLRVQYEDTDAGGIVYHAQYLAFAERARSAWLRCLNIDQSSLLSQERLAFGVTSEVLKITGARVTLRQTITNIHSCLIIARLVVDIGFAKLHGGGMARACRMPLGIRKKLAG